MRPPEYLYKEQEESEKNKIDLESSINTIIEIYEKNDKDYKNNMERIELMNNEFDSSYCFKYMSKIYKEDFFVLCKTVKICYKLLNIFSKDFGQIYDGKKVANYLNPYIFKKIFRENYDVVLINYLLILLKKDDCTEKINLYLTKGLGNKIKYENLTEENYLFFTNSLDDSKSPTIKYNDIGEQKIKIKNIQRERTTARLQAKLRDGENKNLYYRPCDHYPAECTIEKCPCAKRGFCLKYCCCYKETYLNKKQDCTFMFVGCPHTVQNKARCRDCSCQKKNIECVPGICDCGENCENHEITLGKRKKLLFGYSKEINGGGLFAGENILEGEFIDSYDGEIVEKDELDRLSVFYDQTGNNYPFSINDKFDYVTIKCGGLTRYINHASFGKENIKATKKMVNGISYIAFYASKNIKQFDELYYDYGYDDNSMPQWMKEYNKKMENEKKGKKLNKKKYNEKHCIRSHISSEIKNPFSKTINLKEDDDYLYY
jgi:hypothetical protein